MLNPGRTAAPSVDAYNPDPPQGWRLDPPQQQPSPRAGAATRRPRPRLIVTHPPTVSFVDVGGELQLPLGGRGVLQCCVFAVVAGVDDHHLGLLEVFVPAVRHLPVLPGGVKLNAQPSLQTPLDRCWIRRPEPGVADRSFEPFGDEVRAGVHVDHVDLGVTDDFEAVRRQGWCDLDAGTGSDVAYPSAPASAQSSIGALAE